MNKDGKYNIPPQMLDDGRHQVIVCSIIHYVNIAKTDGFEYMKQKNSTERLQKRAIVLQQEINSKGRQNPHWIQFKIMNLDEMIENVLQPLREWNGGKYDKAVTDAFKKTRDYWNREKSKSIGESLIYPILSQLLQVQQISNQL